MPAMRHARLLCLPLLVLVSIPANAAAPDEESLGRAAGYPAAPSLRQVYQEPYIVGSFSAMDSLAASCRLAATTPLPPTCPS